MPIAVVIARVYAGLIGGAGFLFGQLFFDTFSVAASLAGAAGVAAGVFGSPSKRRWPLVVGVCAAGLLGVAGDAIHDYRELDIPGNYYAWKLVGPFVLALLLIGYSSVSARAP